MHFIIYFMRHNLHLFAISIRFSIFYNSVTQYVSLKCINNFQCNSVLSLCHHPLILFSNTILDFSYINPKFIHYQFGSKTIYYYILFINIFLEIKNHHLRLEFYSKIWKHHSTAANLPMCQQQILYHLFLHHYL